MKTQLCELMKKYGSDKGQGMHNYTIYYHNQFKEIKNEKLHIFELGLGSNNTDVPSNMGPFGKPGASLRAWRDYFINANIYGADIDKRILFNEERIQTFYCDQTNEESIKKLWNHEILKTLLFDIIIEDGLHEFKANLKFLINSLDKLSPNGVYICEDLKPNTIELFEKEIVILEQQFKEYSFKIIKLENSENTYNIWNDNNLLVVRKIKNNSKQL
jgi:hypothetical protein